MFVNFEVGNKVYELRLTTRSIVQLEKNIGCNPLEIFGDGDTMPTVSTMVAILHASLQATEKHITMDSAYDIFDAWIEDGHCMTDFINVILDIYKGSGLIKDINPKN